ncbi:hypothetical protein [Streptomyces sp. S.PB5]|uniref:hypothetical protein n=1 Tax=Streptomyces sp. S.PB5 TaxID=3020844 RepID=UPI0025B16227|nr:hypothetical protein [Streptomyces sp. S.PB5]MDN3022797.1 hypothetical protein [Streptomyces sp. S.PB5]
MTKTMKQRAVRAFGVATFGAFLVVTGSGAAAADAELQDRAAVPVDGGLLEDVPLVPEVTKSLEGLPGTGLPSAGIVPKLDQVNMGVPPEVAWLASTLGIKGINPLDNP